ncbi:uncharacterized protein [Eurosta solidaginis]|uniref:uncharacterized protein n=1 Tax=Eurosta solidaginis TaxID=178769 RepID=UPI0035309690
MDDNLVQLVRDCPCLYDKTHKDFKDSNKKRLPWIKIGSNLGVDESVAMKRWGNLRDRFGKELRNSNRASGSGAVNGRQWELMESLQFLRGHIVPRPMRQSSQMLDCGSKEVCLGFSEPLICSTPTPQCSPIPSAQPPASEPSTITPSEHAPISIPPVEPSAVPPAEVSTDSSAPSTSRRKRAADKRDDLDAAILDTVKTFKEVCERKARREEFSSDVRGFRLMMCSAISKLRESRQAMVMQRCTEIVMQAQIEEHDEAQYEICYEPTV